MERSWFEATLEKEGDSVKLDELNVTIIHRGLDFELLFHLIRRWWFKDCARPKEGKGNIQFRLCS